MIAQAKTYQGFGFFIEIGGIDVDKERIRKQMLATLNTISQEEYAQYSRKIKERIIATDEFKKAEIIGITISRYPEVDTRLIIEAAWSLGKQIAVPKCDRKTREMDFRLLTSFDHLETVYMDLLEPVLAKTASVLQEQIDLQIVPGVVFSAEGYRTGFGGGYYDRYLAAYNGRTLSLAFECQTGQDIPIENHDLPIEKIITENNVIDCRKARESK